MAACICAAMVLFCIALLGGSLILHGWRHRDPRDPSRYCRRCEYNLTGVESTQCPECGSELNEHSVVRGRIVRLRASVVTGLC